MSLTTLFPNQPTLVPDTKPRWQGRSKKILRPTITFDGVVFVARYAGRPNRFFGSTPQEANNNLQAGGA